MNHWQFSGSYDPADALILMTPTKIESTSIEDKEKLIQSGEKHYSEMLTSEAPPSSEYMELFYDSVDRNILQFSAHCILLAQSLQKSQSGKITLVSLARAGTPIGAILKRVLRRLGTESTHYSLSIIRDRGIDLTAIKYVLKSHEPETIRFIDGWTGKGVMSRELRKSLDNLPDSSLSRIDRGLYTIADLSGDAAHAVTTADYLIPCGILGATVSGLVSRSVRPTNHRQKHHFDLCREYPEFKTIDLTNWFLDLVDKTCTDLLSDLVSVNSYSKASLSETWKTRKKAMSRLMTENGLTDENLFKPGICESTRVLLRRSPELLFIRNEDNPEIQHLLKLAKTQGTPIQVLPNLPWEAAALIKSLRT